MHPSEILGEDWHTVGGWGNEAEIIVSTRNEPS